MSDLRKDHRQKPVVFYTLNMPCKTNFAAFGIVIRRSMIWGELLTAITGTGILVAHGMKTDVNKKRRLAHLRTVACIGRDGRRV